MLSTYGRSRVFQIVLGVLILWLFIALLPVEDFSYRFEIVTFALFVFSLLTSILANRSSLSFYLKIFLKSTFIYSLVQALVTLFFSQTENVIRPSLVYLTLGYDNGVHLEKFVSTALEAGAIGIAGYPMGLYTFWYLISKILNISFDNSNEVAMTFIFLTVLTWAFATFSAYGVIARSSSRRLVVLLKVFVFTFVLSFGVYGFMLTSGYPPYLFAASIILLLLSSLGTCEQKSMQLLFVLGAFTIGMLVAPLVAATIVPLTLYISWSYLNQAAWFLKLRHSKFEIPVFVSALLAFVFVFVYLLDNYGVRQVFERGGIEPLRYRWILLLITLCIFITLAIHKKIFQSGENLGNVLLSALVMSIILAILTLSVNRAITYYAIKEFQIVGLLLLVIVLRLTPARTQISKSLMIAVYIATFLLMMQPAMQPRQFTTGFMGTTQNALRVVSDQATWGYQIVDAPFLLKAAENINLDLKECGIIWTKEHNATLSGRWFNALYPKPVGGCYNIYYNSENQTDDDVLARVADPDIAVVVVVDDRSLSIPQEESVVSSGDRVSRLE